MGDNLETFSFDDDDQGLLQVVLGRHEICVVKANAEKEIQCWGLLSQWPTLGTIYRPSTTSLVEALYIGDNHGIGWLHGCALLQDGGVKCWGKNDQGQLGLGDVTDRSVVDDTLPVLQLLAP